MAYILAEMLRSALLMDDRISTAGNENEDLEEGHDENDPDDSGKLEERDIR